MNNIMNNKDKFQILLNISFTSCAFFLILTSLAIYFYPGGTMYNNPMNPNYDSSANSYLHSMNFLSDLGLYKSWSGESNFLSSILFSYSLFSVSIGILSYYLAMHFLLMKNKELIKYSKIGIFFAVCSSFGFLFVGFTPSDMFLPQHMFFVNLAFRSFLIVMLIYTYLIFKSEYLPNYFSLSYFILFCLVLYYVYILMSGPPLPTVSFGNTDFFTPNKDTLFFNVISQKIVIYGLTFSILYQIILLKKTKYIDLID